MTATVTNSVLGSRPKTGERIVEVPHLITVPGSISQCQVCGANAKSCDPKLFQQTVFALFRVPASNSNGALCTRCSNIAAQACNLRSQLQKLDDKLRCFHIENLYLRLENRASGTLNCSTHLPQGECRPTVDNEACRLCAERFGSTTDLLQHLRSCHGADTPSGVGYSAGPCRPCTVCRCGQTVRLDQTGRISPALSNNVGPSQHADRSCTVSPLSVENTASCYSSLTAAAEAERRLNCAACPQQFGSVVQRRRHQRQAHPLLPAHACKLCEKRFPSPSKLRIHEDSHAGARPHKCNICGRRYHSAQKLHVHTRSHTGERPFVCHMCGRTFASSAYLAQHELTHTGRRPHQCHVCGKQFTQRGTMTKHVRNVHAPIAGRQVAAGAGAAQGIAPMTGSPVPSTTSVERSSTRSH